MSCWSDNHALEKEGLVFVYVAIVSQCLDLSSHEVGRNTSVWRLGPAQASHSST